MAERTLVLADPPKIETPDSLRDLYRSEAPNLITASLSVPPRPSDTDLRIRRADQHYDAGRKAYEEGNLDLARVEFDRAVDILMSAPEKMPDRAKLDRKLDRMVDAIYRYDVDGLGSGDAGDQVAYDKSPLDGILELTFPVDPRLKPQVKEELAATQSQLPLEESDSVLSYIHFFSTERGRKILESGLRRAGRYRPLIERVLKEEGLPQELIYLAQAESGFLPRAVSYKQATGMWQFVRFRGQEYGLEQTRFADDRLDPEKATRAAARHLRDLYAHFGDWYLAMAAYNCGPGCVDRAIQRTGYADFWKLCSLKVLPDQTANYVPVILAMTIMAKNPKDYGLDVDADAPLEYDNLTLTAPTGINLLADACRCTVPEIRELNPALLRNIAAVGYQVHLPKGTKEMAEAAISSVPADHRNSWRLHRVEPGDTVALLARRYNASTASIASINSLSAGLEEGSMLIIPVTYTPERNVIRHRTSAKIAATSRRPTHGTSGAVKASAPGTRTAAARHVPAKPATHKTARSYKTAVLHQPGL
ncbi:MAG TPA: transglycosylase SLT domain-containing protein [Bryobacteraceae bacterium]|nr:transglycosylase SLT domain-containing protein [Bryobacteraceae bacterium]